MARTRAGIDARFGGAADVEQRDQTGRAIIVCPITKDMNRWPPARLAEAVGLAEAIQLEVMDAQTIPIARIRPSTYIGEGIVEILKTKIADYKVDLVIVDTQLGPGQQRNLERALNIKVIDRTGLILEIFGARARTREGKLQVELASLTYQRSRLVRAWTHLERQRGGGGFIGGPGETQKELDRRRLDDRIVKIKLELQDVVRTRDLHRKARARVPYPIVALVGYTNAGKSTLFNKLTRANVMAEDLLFATLDPTMRQVRLPSGRQIMLSDTVGFIDDLPTHLVAAFRATLEEVLQADLIIHLQDASSDERRVHSEAVTDILEQMEIDVKDDSRVLRVFNKIDILPPEERRALVSSTDFDNSITISAVEGTGLPTLLKAIDTRLSGTSDLHTYKLDFEDGAALAWLYRHGDVIKRRDNKKSLLVDVLLSPDKTAQFESKYLV